MCRFINRETNQAKLIGFTVQNGYTGSDEFAGGVHIIGSGPVLDNLIIKNNNAQSGRGGGVHCYYAKHPIISNTKFENNISSDMGGALHLFASHLDIINCEFVNNSAPSGAAIFIYRASANIINSVIHSNITGNNAINIYEQSEEVYFINSVISNNNTPVGIMLSGNCAPKMINTIVSGHSEFDIQITGGGPFWIDYSIIEGGEENIDIVHPEQIQYGEHNINDNPLFVDVLNNNYAISDYSPGVGSGISNLVLAEDTLVAPNFDIINNDRPQPIGSNPDIGAYENPLGQPLISGDSSLVAHYPFNGNANDESGNGNNGTVNGATLTQDRFGNANTAYDFDGIDDFIQLPTNTYFDGDFTTSAWIKLRQYPHGVVYDFGNGNDNNTVRPIIGATGTPSYHFQIFENTAGGNYFCDEQIPLNTWKHLVVVLNGYQLSFYIDGDSVNTVTTTTIPLNVNRTINYFARSSCTWCDYTDAILDDIIIYNRSLTKLEIDSLYHVGGWDSGVVAHYPFNGNANDESGNGHDGNVNGATLATDRFGYDNKAYYFDGSQDWITVDNINGDFEVVTTSFWFKNPQATVYYPVYFWWQNIGWCQEGSWNPYVSGDIVIIPSNRGLQNLPFPSFDEWHHVVVSWDYVLQTGTIFLDGQFDSTINGTGWENNTGIDAGILVFGNNPGYGSNEQFTGQLDDISIYKRVLTTLEIDNLYHEGGWGVVTADFIASDTTALIGDIINFTDFSTGNPTNWQWDFGDGNNDTIQNPTHIYQTVGSYTVTLVASNNTDNDTLTKVDYISVQVDSIHFIPVWINNPYQPMAIVITSATLYGLDVLVGDEIGLFDVDSLGNEICVGAGTVTDSIIPGAPLTLTVSTDDPFTTDVDGFTDGNTIIFRLWDSNQQVEFVNFTATFNLAFDQVYIPMGTAIVEVDFNSLITQTIELSTGWNIASMMVVADDMNMLNILQPLVDSSELQKTIDEAGGFIQFIPGVGWMNTVGDMANTEGYYIKVTTTTQFDVIGLPVTLPYSIPLYSGWNIMGYPVPVPQNALTSLQPLIDSSELWKVIDESGSFIQNIPGIGWMNTIGDFETDEGYYIRVNANTNLMLDTTTTTSTWQCGDTIVDSRDGQTYSTVLIGNQCWMAENVSFLPEVSPSNSISLTIPHYYVYDYTGSSISEAKETTNYGVYGVLYNWSAAMSSCPEGWHIPSSSEWDTIANSLGGNAVAGEKMKTTGTEYWTSPNIATNSSGFSGLPGGAKDNVALTSFYNMGGHGYWWTSTESNDLNVYYEELHNNWTSLMQWNTADITIEGKSYGFSVRCVKD